MPEVSLRDKTPESFLSASSSNASDTLVRDAPPPPRHTAPDYPHHFKHLRRFRVDAMHGGVEPLRRVGVAFSPELPSDDDRALTSWNQANQVLLVASYSAYEDSAARGSAYADQAWSRLFRILTESHPRRDQSHDAFEAYRSRIQELIEEATLDGISPNMSSERDFWSFMRSRPSARRAGIVLLDNGNLRAVWRDDMSILVGLQFLGMGWIEYVILKRRVGSARVSQTSGIDTSEAVKGQLRAFELTSWMNA